MIAESNTIAMAAMVTRAAPRMKDRPIPNRPSMLITTVPPASRTERPAVSKVATDASCGLRPAARHSRNLVTISSA